MTDQPREEFDKPIEEEEEVAGHSFEGHEGDAHLKRPETEPAEDPTER
jgi:hypothetical protein